MSSDNSNYSGDKSKPSDLSGDQSKNINPYMELSNKMRGYIDRLEDAIRGKDNGRLPTGWWALDELTGGFAPGRLWVVASLPGVGKTTFLSNIVDQLCVRKKVPSLIKFYKGGSQDFILRMTCVKGEMAFEELQRYGKFLERPTREKIVMMKECIDGILESPLIIDDSRTLDLIEIESRAHSASKFNDMRLIAIDDLKRFNNYSSEGEWKNFYLIKGLKDLAREINVPIVVMTGMKSGSELKSVDRTLSLSDIYDDEEIEKHADVVCLLSDASGDDGFYWSESNENCSRRSLDVVMNRHGKTGRVGMELCRNTLRFNAVPQIAPTSYEEEREIISCMRHRKDLDLLDKIGGEEVLDWPEAMIEFDLIPRAIDAIKPES
jgi:replicative DNA helicase